MLLALLVLAVVAIALTAPVAARLLRDWHSARKRRRARHETSERLDPGRERRAEQRARELLRSCVDEHEWMMYRDLGFIRVLGRRRSQPNVESPAYAYLIYPHKPIVAYVPASGRVLNEYCVEFPDLSETLSSSRLPASDDVLAKWMALTGDEERVLRSANMHLPGRQVDPARIRRDLWRLREWERRWAQRPAARPSRP